MKSKEFYNTTAWKYFSKYIILKYAYETSAGLAVNCATSGKLYLLPDKRVHCGHWVKVFDGNSTNFSTAFDERNCLPQSAYDNTYRSGKEYAMAKKIDSIHGEGTCDELMIKKHTACKLDKFYLDSIAKHYKEKFTMLVNSKGNPWK